MKNITKLLNNQPRYFDRPKNCHPWEQPFKELESCGDPTQRIVVSNWQMDHRVSQERETTLIQHPTFDPVAKKGSRWWSQIHEYFRQALCRPANSIAGSITSAYVLPDNNTNFIPAGSPVPHDLLIHVASLDRILWRLADGTYSTARIGMKLNTLFGVAFPQRTPGDFDGSVFKASINKLAHHMQGADVKTVQEITGMLVDALGDNQPFWWGCFAQEVRPYVNAKDGVGLARALGLGHLEAKEWLLLWRYPVHTARPLYRPTVVEANNNPSHFPSPPDVSYGITMSLNIKDKIALREVIHAPLRNNAATQFCTGELIQLAETSLSDHNLINDFRKEHRLRLRRTYSSPIQTRWLDRNK